jgi:hypothetical protein
MANIVEFIGGFRDGTRASSASEDPEEAKFAETMYFLSHQGEIGRKHRGYSDAAMHVLPTEGPEALIKQGLDMDHFYKVVSKTVEGDYTIVRFESAKQ